MSAVAFATPLRAVDRVEPVLATAGTTTLRLRAHKVVSVADPYMTGHFPQLTMLPAVFLLEGLRQALMAGLGVTEPLELVEVRSARLLAPMLGGNRIDIDATVEPAGTGQWTVTARCARQDGTPVAALKVVIGTCQRPRIETPAPPPAPAGAPAIGHSRIRELLPVRHPILLVDQVVSVDPGHSISALKAVNGSEPCYQGLPEGLPNHRYAYPRSLMLESFGQAAALLWLSSSAERTASTVLMLATVRNCTFAGAVYPGEVLRHEIQLDQVAGDNAFLSGHTWAGDRCVAAMGSLIAVIRPRDEIPSAG